MEINKGGCFGFIVGFFILSPLLTQIGLGSLRGTFNYAIHGIIGMGVSILVGYFFAWLDKKSKKMKRTKTSYKGIDFDKFISDKEGHAVSCIDEDRIILKGKPKISICKNQQKFGDEVEISLICHKDNGFKKEKRNKSVWNVLEIYLPIDQALEMFNGVISQLEAYKK